MSIWDWLVIFLAVAQLLTLVAIAIVVLKLKNGPVTRSIKHVKAFVNQGKRMEATIKRIMDGSLPHLLGMRREVTETGTTLKKATSEFNTAMAGPREVLMQWAKLQSGVGYAQLGINLAKRGFPKKQPKTATKATIVRRSLVHRLGLVPPVIEKLGRFTPYIGHAVSVYRALKDRGIL